PRPAMMPTTTRARPAMSWPWPPRARPAKAVARSVAVGGGGGLRVGVRAPPERAALDRPPPVVRGFAAPEDRVVCLAAVTTTLTPAPPATVGWIEPGRGRSGPRWRRDEHRRPTLRRPAGGHPRRRGGHAVAEPTRQAQRRHRGDVGRDQR